MYAPGPRDFVAVDGRDGRFFVLTVDQDAGRADLVALDGHPYLLSKVPFSQLKPYRQQEEPATAGD